VHSNSHSNNFSAKSGVRWVGWRGSQVGGMERKLRVGVRTEEKLGCRPMYQIL
jgi:hypothetical protein